VSLSVLHPVDQRILPSLARTGRDLRRVACFPGFMHHVSYAGDDFHAFLDPFLCLSPALSCRVWKATTTKTPIVEIAAEMEAIASRNDSALFSHSYLNPAFNTTDSTAALTSHVPVRSLENEIRIQQQMPVALAGA
jgi:hypothetical protein